jgi:hypothetical protein
VSPRLPRLLAALTALLAVSGPGAASAQEIHQPSDPLEDWPRDPVYVFYPRDSCRTGELEIQVWSRRADEWVPHPVHPRVPPETCQLEDADVLWNELRRRCTRATAGGAAGPWIVGLDVFDPGLIARCEVSLGDAPDGMAIEIASPDPSGAVRAPEPVATVRGRVLVDGRNGALYDVVIAIDRSPTSDGDGRLLRSQIEAARTLLAAERGRLGDVRIGLVTHPGPDLGLPLGAGPAAIERTLRAIAAAGTTGRPDLGTGLARGLDALGRSERAGAHRRLLLLADGSRAIPFGLDDQQSARERSRVLELARTLDERGVALHLFALGGIAAEPSPLVRAITAGHASRFDRVREPLESSDYLLASRLPWVRSVSVRNQTTGQRVEDVAYTSAGLFEAELPVTFGRNELVVEARSSDDEHAKVVHAFRFDGTLVRERLLEAERERIERARRRRDLIVEPEEPDAPDEPDAPEPAPGPGARGPDVR